MKLFLTGASGFIGGSIGAEAVRRGHAVRGLVRSADKADLCRAFGMVPVLGTLADHELIAREARAADATVNAASSDDRGVADTLIAALAGSGKALIHTSGSSIVAQGARIEACGEPSDAVFDEDHLPEPSADKQARVALDRAILAAPGLRSVVLCNSLIYGDALGPAARSVQLPLLIDEARESGTAHYIGRGLNRWSTVHIADVVDLYLLALDKAPPRTFAFVESAEAAFRDMAQAIGESLGLGDAASMPPEAAERRWGRQRAVFSLGSNSRVRGRRARALGWTPRRESVDRWIRGSLSRR